MSRAEDFAVEVVCEGVLRGWVGSERVREEEGSRREWWAYA